jgi:hypothetical protein
MGPCVKPDAWIRGTKLSWEEFVNAVHSPVPPSAMGDGKKSHLETYRIAASQLSWKIANVKQHHVIDKDTRRCVTKHPIFGSFKEDCHESVGSSTDEETGVVNNGVPAISRILHAYTHHATGFGYTQGMSAMVAYFLLVMGDEERTFWLLCAVMEKCSKVFDTDMKLAIDVMIANIRSQGISKFLPSLSKDEVQTTLHYFTCRWYPSLFHLMFHGSAWMRVWDVFLYTIYESTHANTSFDSKHDHTRPSEEQDKIEKELHKLFARVAVALIKAHPRFLMPCEKMMSDTRPCDFEKFMKIFCP